MTPLSNTRHLSPGPRAGLGVWDKPALLAWSQGTAQPAAQNRAIGCKTELSLWNRSWQPTGQVRRPPANWTSLSAVLSTIQNSLGQQAPVSAHLVSWPSALCLPRSSSAASPRQLHTWHSRSAPSFAPHQRGPALPLAVRNHEPELPWQSIWHGSFSPQWGQGWCQGRSKASRASKTYKRSANLHYGNFHESFICQLLGLKYVIIGINGNNR